MEESLKVQFVEEPEKNPDGLKDIHRMSTLEKVAKYLDSPPHPALKRIICTNLKFTCIRLDAVAIRVDREVAHTQTAHFKQIVRYGDEALKADLEMMGRIKEGEIKRLETTPMPFDKMYLSALSLGKEEKRLFTHLHQIMQWAQVDKVKVLGLEILGTITEGTYPPKDSLEKIGEFLASSLPTLKFPETVVIYMETNKKREYQNILLETIQSQLEHSTKNSAQTIGNEQTTAISPTQDLTLTQHEQDRLEIHDAMESIITVIEMCGRAHGEPYDQDLDLVHSVEDTVTGENPTAYGPAEPQAEGEMEYLMDIAKQLSEDLSKLGQQAYGSAKREQQIISQMSNWAAYFPIMTNKSLGRKLKPFEVVTIEEIMKDIKPDHKDITIAGIQTARI